MIRVEKHSFTVICGQKVLVNPTVLEIFCQDLWSKALVLVNPTVLEMFCQDLGSKALVLVDPTVLEIF